MSIEKNYNFQSSETKWYQHWLDQKYFESTPDHRPSYTIVIPPPNVTGILHMGHCLNNTIQDILIRRARQTGYNACWVPGTDHASIATEAKVVAMLRERGIDKKTLSRDEFLKYAWEWKEKYGGIILQQLKKLGCALDWNRTDFTMDDDYYDAVINVFIDLYNKGYIYRGVKMINWDPKAKTALSDEEVIYKEVKSNLYYVRYKIEAPSQPSPKEKELNNDEYIVVATTRPETILGDTAVCVHPDDERYAHLKGKFCFVPLINRRVPIIFDTYIDKEFGTGALKVTPAHDLNDYNLGIKHKLEVVDTLNEDGTMSEAAQLYIGEDRFVVRKKIAKELDAKGFLVKTEEITNNNGFSERTDVVIEPRLSMQWWCTMKELSKPALDDVLNDEIKFYPAKFKNTYKHWMENIKEWCISRQLWWGHRIPAWYDEKGNMVIAKTHEEALINYKKQFSNTTIKQLRQDEDVLDTWFSSWLWPLEVFKGMTNPNNKDINYYYPTATLVTAPEIIFFWVARMIMAGHEYMHKKPFDQVYFTGIVRDKQGRKMSKSLGNSPDLLGLIDNYGADAVRFGILITSPAGNDLLYDDKLCDQGKNFTNKIWNALRLIKGWEVEESAYENEFAVTWFENKLNETQLKLSEQFKSFAMSESLKTVYSLIWDDFCAWYLEMIKPDYEKPIGPKTYQATINFFSELMKLLHPYMPFITEEIYQLLADRNGESICNEQLKTVATPNQKALNDGELLIAIISNIRDIRAKNQIKPKEEIGLKYQNSNVDSFDTIKPTLKRLGYIKNFDSNILNIENSFPFTLKGDKFYVIAEREVDIDSEYKRLEKELEHANGFLKSVEAKLNNEKFVANAKVDVLEKEKLKQTDALNKIKAVNEELKRIMSMKN
jgi:valyl-tRNA synthetase